ncbi:MAG: sugar transferase [Rhodobacteraceae bacterium]|nr:sugar transferase [Paracoccaceae bacterium]
MTVSKRLFDVALVLLGLAPAMIVMFVVALCVLLRDGRPIFYGSERMRDPSTPFILWKFRTMVTDAADSGVTGGDKARRLTRSGTWLRKSRIDELPQIFNVLRGDMSLVGPRPPLRRYVEMFPELYAEVLGARPGMTGLATLHCGAYEERILSACRTAAETEAAYVRRCIPRKARLDKIYREKRNLCLDVAVLAGTVRRIVRD